MTGGPIPDDRLKGLLNRAGVGPDDAMTRREFPRFTAEGRVSFTRPMERGENVGELVDVSEGGLSFLTAVSVSVGETLLVTFDDDGRPRSRQATVETLHSRPKEQRFVVGAKFIR